MSGERHFIPKEDLLGWLDFFAIPIFRSDTYTMDEKDYFLEKLEMAISRWPDGIQWNLIQLSSYTTYPSDQVLEWLNESSETALGSNERFDREAIRQICDRLKNNQKIDKVSREQKYQDSLGQIKKKILQYESKKEWAKAYQSLNYYLGQHDETLSFADKIDLYNDALRLAFKADRNLQEIAATLSKIIDESFRKCDKEKIALLLDTFDAFSDQFKRTEAGTKIVTLALKRVNDTALETPLPAATKEAIRVFVTDFA